MERGRIQGLSKFFGYPLLSQERVKLRTSNFVGIFIGSYFLYLGTCYLLMQTVCLGVRLTFLLWSCSCLSYCASLMLLIWLIDWLIDWLMQRLSLRRHVCRWRQRLPLRMRSWLYWLQLSTSDQPLRLESVPERRTLLWEVTYHLRLFVPTRFHRSALWELRRLVWGWRQSMSQWWNLRPAE